MLGKTTEEQLEARTMPARITPQSMCSAKREFTFCPCNMYQQILQNEVSDTIQKEKIFILTQRFLSPGPKSGCPMALSLESSWQEHVTEQTTYLMIWEANERYREEILSQKKKRKRKTRHLQGHDFNDLMTTDKAQTPKGFTCPKNITLVMKSLCMVVPRENATNLQITAS